MLKLIQFAMPLALPSDFIIFFTINLYYLYTYIVERSYQLKHNNNFPRPYGIGVATGEMCANRVMFKQFLQADAVQYCQIDSARIGGVNELLAIYLMAAKLNGIF